MTDLVSIKIAQGKFVFSGHKWNLQYRKIQL